MIASQFGAPVSGAITGGGLAFEKTPETATWGETGKNVGEGSLLGEFAGWLGKGRAWANEEMMRRIRQQLASPNQAVFSGRSIKSRGRLRSRRPFAIFR